MKRYTEIFSVHTLCRKRLTINTSNIFEALTFDIISVTAN